MIHRAAALCLPALVLPACVGVPSEDGPAADRRTDSDLPSTTMAPEVARLLAGRFDSSAQAARDRRYFEVQLHACAVEAPALGEHVLYVEQAMLSAVDAPYRQRVYVVTEEGDAVVSAVLELDAPEQVIGICDFSATDRARVLGERTLTPLEGCEVVLRPTEEGFSGSTRGEACANDYGGAVYATSEVTVTETQVISWDRGYDATGAQVWGATDGAYVFDRVE